jgi:transcription antitermination factor NusB
MGKRRKARELVLQALYALELSGEDIGTVLEQLPELDAVSADVRQFANALATKTVSHLDQIDEIISQNVQRWELSRIAVVDKNILRFAICELLYFPDIPQKVSINEAIELAKIFSTKESGRFVNGILDSVAGLHGSGGDASLGGEQTQG